MKKDLVIAVIILSVLALTFVNVDIKSVDEYYSQNPLGVSEDTPCVTLHIECKDILLNNYTNSAYNNGEVFEDEKVVLLEDETVFDIVSKVCNYENISFSFNGTPRSALSPAYITEFGGIGEFDYGKLSGWQYSVNGKSADKSCDQYELEEGDLIEFSYVCDYTKGGDL